MFSSFHAPGRAGALLLAQASDLTRRGELEQAEKILSGLLAQNPRNAEVCNRLGGVAFLKHDLKQAKLLFRKAIKLEPNQPHFHANLGNVLAGQYFWKEAEKSYRTAMRLDPGDAGHVSGLAGTMKKQGNYRQAEMLYHSALSMQPDDYEINRNIAHLMLLLGRYREGWQQLENRWRLGNRPSKIAGMDKPLWDGGPLEGQILLLHAEQGLGDSVQFARYIPLAARSGARLVVRVQPELVKLLDVYTDIAEIGSLDEALPEFVCHCPLMALPARVFPDKPLSDFRPLSPEPERAVVLGDQRVKVGFSWAGNPGHRNDLNRSIGLQNLLPLLSQAAEDPAVGLYSFQKDLKSGDQEILEGQPHVFPLGQRQLDLDAVAATMQKMDVMITVDSALAHLAGSLSKPCWLMLPYVPDFRWGVEGAKTDWYRSVRLFRQKKPGDWKPVVAEICQALKEMAAE